MKIEFRDKDKIRRRYLWLWLGIKRNWFPTGKAHRDAQVQVGLLEWLIKREERRERAPRIKIKEKEVEDETER